MPARRHPLAFARCVLRVVALTALVAAAPARSAPVSGRWVQASAVSVTPGPRFVMASAYDPVRKRMLT